MAIKSAVETITPEIATKILEESKDVKNRNVVDKHVEWLGAQMKAGKWVMNGEAIIIDDEGQVVDGQHRLWAVVNSGATIETMVTRGVDRRGFATIDTGNARTVGNVLGITGEKQSNNLATALSWIYRHDLGKMLWQSKKAGFTSQIALSLIRKHPEVRDSVEFAQKVHRVEPWSRVALSTMIFLHFMFSRHSKDKAIEFFETVGDQRFDTDGTCTRTLRNYILRRDRSIQGMQATLELMAIIVKGFGYFLDGRSGVRAYVWRRGGEAPEDFPKFPGERESSGKAMKIVRRTTKKAANG
jgi:hypothetical protein